MRYRLRTLLPGQFGLLALLVLVTVSAIGFAIVRLPIPVAAKLGPLAALIICFVGWTLRNHKFADPRSVATATPAQKLVRAVVYLLIAVSWLGYMTWCYLGMGTRLPWFSSLMSGLTAVLIAAAFIGQAIAAFKRA